MSKRNRRLKGKSNETSVFLSPNNSNTENESPRKSRLLKSLESNLSPKYIGISPGSEGKRSRYGREQKFKEDDDFLPTDVLYSYRRSRSLQHTPSRFSQNNNIIKISPLPRFEKFYESPIDKLLNKNRELAAQHGSAIKLMTDTIQITPKSNRDEMVEITKRTLFNSSEENSVAELESDNAEDQAQLEEFVEECGTLDISWSSMPDVMLLSPKHGEMEPVLDCIEPALDSIDPVLDCIEPALDCIEQIVDTVVEDEPQPTDNTEIITVIETVDEIEDADDIEIENDSAKSEFTFNEGDILWGKIGKFPYWPCIVCPNDENLCVSDHGNVKKVHIKFFADNGRRSWVAESQTLSYNGLDDFNRLKDESTPKGVAKKRTSRNFSTGFNVPPGSKDKWMKAITEADIIAAYPIEERLKEFEAILNEEMKRIQEERNRRRSIRKSQNMQTKRNRSPTPESPMYEPIIATGKRIKHEHLSDFSADLFSSTTLTDDYNRVLEVSRLVEDYRKNVLKPNPEMVIDEVGLTNFIDKMWSIKQMELRNGGAGRSIFIKLETDATPVVKVEMDLSSQISDETRASSSVSMATPRRSPSPTNMSEFTKNYLFRKLTKGFVCRICLKPDNVLKCEGICSGWYHQTCIPKPTGSSARLGDFLCTDCRNDKKPPCFVCGLHLEPQNRLKCKFGACGRYFHEACLKYFPQAKIINVTTLVCPAHACHICISDDPRGKYVAAEHTTYVKCVKCPSSYHMDSACIPAGTEFITANQIICPKHRDRVNINANWCFICAKGGSLVCCETCPTAFHAECLNIPLPEDKSYICEECETGRLPLYGELVWAKLGNYRWWPAQIIPPPAIPDNVTRLNRKSSDFCVKFFGSNNYSWIDRGRVYLYQEGDWGTTKNSRGFEASYRKALAEAKDMWQLLNDQKIKKMSKEKTRYKPKPYIKLKANRPVPPVRLIEEDECDLSKCTCNPDDPEPCGPDSKCINRLLMIECNPKVCPAKDRCLNQMFNKRISPKLEVKRTEHRGWGLIALEPIKCGTFVLEYVGEVIDNEEFRRRLEGKRREMDDNYYFLTLDSNHLIDAGPRGNAARFINHSCEPNCETQKWTINGITRIGLFASTDIEANTELTFNYNWDCLGEQMKICHCGARKCSGFIGAKYRNGDNKSKLRRSTTDSVATSSSATGSLKTKPLKKKRKNKKVIKKPKEVIAPSLVVPPNP